MPPDNGETGADMGRRVLQAVVVAATTGVGVGLLSPIAAHAAVACGQTITASVTLDHHLNCPASNGIFIGASNVVLDLGGHTITGPAPTATTGVGVRGVIVLQNRTGVTVRNGTIRGFDSAVDVAPGANSTTVTGLLLDGNGLGIRVSTGTSSNRLTANTIINTTRFSGMQVGGNGHVIEDNTLNNVHGTGVILSGSNNVIRNNRLNGMGAAGIAVDAFPSNPGPFVGNQVIDNRIVGSSRVFNSSSISVSAGSGSLIQGNIVHGRRTTPGVFVADSANTVVSGNSLTNNSSGVLIRGASTGTKVTGNQATTSNFAGIAVENAPTGTLVADNVAGSNGGNGIDVRNPATTITRNTAVSNGNLGIFAVNGVTDGGGNRAFANGNPAQCSPSIVCTN
jgi:parallel beta-helix repeat protein